MCNALHVNIACSQGVGFDEIAAGFDLVWFGVVMAVVTGGSMALLPRLFGDVGGIAGMLLLMVLALLGALLLVVLASLPARAYREARLFQLVWNNVGVSTIARSKTSLRTAAYVWLRVKNMLLTLITLGFYRPFAVASEYAAKVDSVTLYLKGGTDQLVGELVKLSNPQDVANHVSKAASASLEQAVNHSRNLYEAVSEIQGEVAKLAEENIGLLNKSMISTIDALAKNAPAGSESAVNAVKSGIAASAAAVNSMTKAAQQVAEFAGTSVKAASTATADAVRNASKKAASQATA